MARCSFGVGRPTDGASGNVKSPTEVLANGGCNHNGFKAVKPSAGQALIRMNGATTVRSLLFEI